MHQSDQASRVLAVPRSVIVYFLFAFALSWGWVALVTLPFGYPGTAEIVAMRSGPAFVGMLLGPPLAAFIATSILFGRAELADLFGSLWVWRLRPVYYALALLLVPAVILVVLGLFSLTSGAYVPAAFTAGGGVGFVLGGLAAGLIAGYFEEIGWTGFALRRLLGRHPILSTAVVFGAVHAFWHLFAGYWGEAYVYGGFFALYFFLAWGIGLIGLRLVIAFLVYRTGSTLIAQLAHASYTGGLLVFWPKTTTPWENVLWTGCFAFVLLAIGLVLAYRAARR